MRISKTYVRPEEIDTVQFVRGGSVRKLIINLSDGFPLIFSGRQNIVKLLRLYNVSYLDLLKMKNPNDFLLSVLKYYDTLILKFEYLRRGGVGHVVNVAFIENPLDDYSKFVSQLLDLFATIDVVGVDYVYFEQGLLSIAKLKNPFTLITYYSDTSDTLRLWGGKYDNDVILTLTTLHYVYPAYSRRRFSFEFKKVLHEFNNSKIVICQYDDEKVNALLALLSQTIPLYALNEIRREIEVYMSDKQNNITNYDIATIFGRFIYRHYADYMKFELMKYQNLLLRNKF